MESYKVIILKSTTKSFSWNNGMFAIENDADNLLHLWKIKNGKLEIFPDGFKNICVISKNNKGIIETNLRITEQD